MVPCYDGFSSTGHELLNLSEIGVLITHVRQFLQLHTVLRVDLLLLQPCSLCYLRVADSNNVGHGGAMVTVGRVLCHNEMGEKRVPIYRICRNEPLDLGLIYKS